MSFSSRGEKEDGFRKEPVSVSAASAEADTINKAALGDNLPAGYYSSIQFIGTVVGLTLASISAYIFLIMGTNVLSFTNQDIGPSKSISWVNIARTLSQSFMFLIQGQLSDLFGRRWFFIGGNMVALVGILIGALAQNVPTLIFASAVYGLGECVQLSFGVAIGELVPNKYRPVVMSMMFMASAPIATFGPIIARQFVLDPKLGWRWTYWLNFIVVLVAVALLYVFYHPPTFHMLHERKSKRAQLRQLDYVGMLLWTAGLTLFLLGVSWGGVMFPWKSGEVIAALLVGIALLAAMGCWEGFANPKYPVMPMSFLANRGYMSLVACATVASMFYYSAVLLWPQQVSAMYTKDVNYAGWLSCTVSASTALGQAAAGFIIRWGGNVRYWLIFASLAMVSFVSALAALTPATKTLGIALTILGPFWVGFIELASLSLAPLFCKPEDIGLASGMLASIRSAGGSIAVAVYSTILTNRLGATLTADVGAVAVSAGLPPERVPALVAAIQAGSLAKFPGLTQPVTSAVVATTPLAFAQAFKTVYLASIGFGGIAIIGSLFTKDAQRHLTDKVERRMHGKRLGEDGNAQHFGDKLGEE